MGHLLGACITEMNIMMQSQIVVYCPGNIPICVNQSGNSFIKSSVDLMGLAAVAVGAGAGLGGLVSDWATVMAQFIFTTA